MVRLILIAFLLTSLPAVATERLSDPTRPAYVPSKKGKAKLTKAGSKRLLTAIFMKQGNRLAIINDRLYKTGDFFAGKKIISIKGNRILLRGATGTSQLTLVKPFKKMKKQ